MRRVLPWLMVLGLLVVPAYAQKKDDKKDDKKVANRKDDDRKNDLPQLKNPPSEREVERAASRARFMQDRTIRRDFRDGRIFFTPADLGGLSSEQLANGFILGYIETNRESPSGIRGDGNQMRRYMVFVDKRGNDWNTWFSHAGQVQAKSRNTEGNLDSVHPPVWAKGGDAIWYWRIRFEY